MLLENVNIEEFYRQYFSFGSTFYLPINKVTENFETIIQKYFILLKKKAEEIKNCLFCKEKLKRSDDHLLSDLR